MRKLLTPFANYGGELRPFFIIGRSLICHANCSLRCKIKEEKLTRHQEYRVLCQLSEKCVRSENLILIVV